MRRALFERPNRVLSIGYGLLLLGVGALFVADFFMLRFAEAANARDYRRFVASANDALIARNFPAARADIDRAIELAPEQPEPYVALGHLQYALKRWDTAIEAYRRAVELGSADTGIRQNVVWSYIELGRFDEAAAFGKAALEAGAEGPALARYVAEAYFRKKAYAEAIPYYERALAKFPKELYLMDHLRRAYREAGRKDGEQEMDRRIAEVESAISRTGSAAP